MVGDLLLAWMEIWVDLLAHLVEFQPTADRLPSEVEVRVMVGRLLPEQTALEHCIPDESRVVTCGHRKPQLMRIRRRSSSDGL